MTRAIFPLGHYFGQFHAAKGADLEYHVIRLGQETPKLPDNVHATVWGLLHCPVQLAENTGPWTRDHVQLAAAGIGLTNPEPIIDELLHVGAAIEVPCTETGLINFAHTYRLRTLLHGLGNTARDPHMYGIGLPDVEPILRVSIQEYELWQWAPVTRTLWDTYILLTEMWRRSGERHDLNIDPARRLCHDVESLTLHKFIAAGAGYLDLAADDSHLVGDN